MCVCGGWDEQLPVPQLSSALKRVFGPIHTGALAQLHSACNSAGIASASHPQRLSLGTVCPTSAPYPQAVRPAAAHGALT